MPPSQAKFLIYLICGIVTSLAIAVYAWNNPHARGRKAFVLGVISSCLWMLGSLIGRWTDSFAGQYLAEMVRYLGVMQLPVWMFAFTRHYCGRPVSRRLLQWLLIIPVFSYLVMITSLWHRWFYLSMEAGSPDMPGFDGLINVYGPYFWWIHLPYSYGLLLLSMLLVIGEIGRVPPQFRGQVIYLLLSLSVPLAINAGGLSGVLPGNYTALSFPAFSLLITFGALRHRFMGVNTIAYETVVQTIRDCVIILDGRDIIVDINAAAARELDAPRNAIIGKPLSLVFAAWPELLDRCQFKTELNHEFTQEASQKSRHFSLHVSNLVGIDHQLDGRTLTLRDITDSKNYQISLETLAYYDPLTRLANRRRFSEEVEKELQRAARHREEFAILYFDLNRFKAVNDTLGHEFGDELLQCVGARTSEMLRLPDFVARLGGDEFVILLHRTTVEEIETVAARLLDHVQQPLKVRGHLLLPQLSLGAAFYPKDATDLKGLLRHADAAMYQAKANGGGLHLLNLRD